MSEEMKKGQARTEQDWLVNISHFLCDVENMNEDDIEEALRAEGLDPDQVVRRGMELIENLRRQATYRTFAEAKELQSRALEAVADIQESRSPIEEIKRKIRNIQESWSAQGQLGFAVNFRNLEDQSEDDLRTLLADLERVDRLGRDERK
ncbi:MAG: hypothetical protein NTNFB02_35000 [Nitrospira sp.]